MSASDVIRAHARRALAHASEVARPLILCALVLAPAANAHAATATRPPHVALATAPSAMLRTQALESQIGLPLVITDRVLPGTELEVIPADANEALIVRIASVRPHGTDFRYDIELVALEAGTHDLVSRLRRKDRSSTADLPALTVTTVARLGPGQVLPHAPPGGEVPRLGGYRTLWIVGAAVWIAGLAWWFFSGRSRRARALDAAPRTPTLAERLRPLVERALAGELSSTERAQLELSLVAYWRRRLQLEAHTPEDAHAKLRAHPEAGPLLTSLDQWLHRPPSSRDARDVDVQRLLDPYRELPSDALDLPTPAARETAPHDRAGRR